MLKETKGCCVRSLPHNKGLLPCRSRNAIFHRWGDDSQKGPEKSKMWIEKNEDKKQGAPNFRQSLQSLGMWHMDRFLANICVPCWRLLTWVKIWLSMWLKRERREKLISNRAEIQPRSSRQDGICSRSRPQDWVLRTWVYLASACRVNNRW